MLRVAVLALSRVPASPLSGVMRFMLKVRNVSTIFDRAKLYKPVELYKNVRHSLMSKMGTHAARD